MKATWLQWGNKADDRSRFSPMIGSMILVGSIVALLAAVAYAARPDTKPAPVEANRSEAATLIRQALDTSDTAAADVKAHLAEAAKQAAKLLGGDSLIAGGLLAAAEQASQPDSDLVPVRQAFEKAHKMLTFQPLMEAELPRGFPNPGPLGEIRVKEYPAYRMAKSKSGGTAFWTLFRHIKRHEIAMTAPVEMTYGDAESTRPAEQSMAFLYGEPEMGQAGVDGNVEVVDSQPVTVVSIGLNGQRGDSVIEQARDQLMKWIAGQSEYEVAGSLRVLGYNSPFVPRDRQYWEVQVPVRVKGEVVAPTAKN